MRVVADAITTEEDMTGCLLCRLIDIPHSLLQKGEQVVCFFSGSSPGVLLGPPACLVRCASHVPNLLISFGDSG